MSLEREGRILRGVACEWECARRMLDPALARRLRRPLFMLDDATSRWGSWSAERCEIRMSRALIDRHPWDAVREVLFHEMAHQLADELFDARGETAHGPMFLKACRLLGANPRASGHFTLPTEQVRRAAAHGPDRSAERIRKLLALAGSSNPHEADAAMLKAHQLMARVEARSGAAAPEREFFSIFVGRPALRHSRAHYHLAALLRDFYFVLPIWVPAYVLDRSRMGRALEISGTAFQLRTAAYVYAFMQRVIAEEWAHWARRGTVGRRGAAVFGVGVVEGFRARLAAARSRPRAGACGSQLALVPAADPELADYFKRRHPHTTRVGRSAARIHRGALQAGREVGNRLVVSQPAAEIGAAGGLLPGPG
ncbi:MAG: SprT-like domain-containing protein [Desulfobacterales bacterium]|jgi:hypothetical protein|nr:SprT-like domain-containing protein [Desulfobacterales bacterium]